MQTVVPGDVLFIVDNTSWMIANNELNKASVEGDESMNSHHAILQ